MNVLVIPDKFKGSLTAKEVIKSITAGIAKAFSSAKIHSLVASDGGDGFLDAVSGNKVIAKMWVDTVDPLMRPIKAMYLLDSKSKSAYIEMARASGLELLTVQERNAMRTTTFGTGIQIKDAIQKGARRIYLGLGGSATNDGGIGLAKALGYSFLDNLGNTLEPIGSNLIKIAKIEKGSSYDTLNNIAFFAVNDVDNPLFGEHGAAYVYGPQKGVDRKQVQILDDGLVNLHKRAKEQLGHDNAHLPGSGAAGGTAYGLKTFFDADYISGIDFILKLGKVPDFLEKNKVDFIITGEGKIDAQTINGKLVKGVLGLGKTYGVPVIAVCGKLDLDKQQLNALGLNTVLETYESSKGIDFSMQNASTLIENLIFSFFDAINK
ncbi:glycerate kinase [Costertonia aggregata]|uniref:Glycerate kinase n=1 Tax=Costertonia aggregata TaxID=343403 RepID=A0A7H9APT1_9FLAO|nr:glycerate kinase [Costertonia aggregata]QLG45436.1 glycerate kinase [Costertonia aggregata]